jgi:hypothetical protein
MFEGIVSDLLGAVRYDDGLDIGHILGRESLAVAVVLRTSPTPHHRVRTTTIEGGRGGGKRLVVVVVAVVVVVGCCCCCCCCYCSLSTHTVFKTLGLVVSRVCYEGRDA